MAVAAAFPGFPVLIRDATSLSGSIHPHRTSGSTRRSAVSVEQTAAAAAIPPQRRILLEKRQADSAAASSTHYDESEVPEIQRRGLKDFFEESRNLIKSDGGPPRWFSPLDCASPADNTSPLLLYLPGLDGVGLGLILHHQKLGRIFEVWCLHIPVMDRTTFSELVNIVERTVRSEYCRFPNRPIFLVGESLGGCLALVIAARNHDIDLTIISANPATSFGKSPLQPLIPLLEVIPPQLDVSLPHMLSLMTGDPFKMAIANMGKMLSVQKTVGELSQGLLSLSSFLYVLTNMLPRETLLWKLEMLKSASAFTNSRLHAVTAPVLILTGGKDQLLPSMEEGVRLRHALPKCEIRKFEDSGHFLFLEDGVDLAMTIKAAGFYRRGRNKNYVSDYVPPTPSEFLKIYEPYRWIEEVTGTAMFSTLGDGVIVKGLGGIPSEGPVLLVGYHMLLGLELYSLVARYFQEKHVVLRGIAHPLIFSRTENGKLPDSSQFDTFKLMGAVPVSGMNLYRLLSSKSHALLYPGGMREALHRKGEEYKLFWPEQSEFVRMAARFGATIVPFGSVGEDDFGQVVFDYDDLVNIPYFKNEIEQLTNEAAKLRTDAGGEVSNQQVHLPGILPKFPGRFYYLFGKPIETAGRKQELADREKARELYTEIKSEVERCIDYLKEKREEDPYRYLIPRLIYQAMQGFSREAPTFEP